MLYASNTSPSLFYLALVVFEIDVVCCVDDKWKRVAEQRWTDVPN
jgi:hypothetical protein